MKSIRTNTSSLLAWLALVAIGISPQVASGEERRDRSLPTPAGVKQVELTGLLSDRHQANVAFLLHLHRQHAALMTEAFSLRGERDQERGWDGEYAGKWLDAASLMAAATSHPQLTRRTDELAEAMRQSQEPDGYMGIEDPPRRGRASWDVWNHWYANTGWLTHYEQFGDKASLEAACRSGRWLLDQYGRRPDRGNWQFFQGAWEGGCNVAVIDQLVRQMQHRPDAELLNFVEDIADGYPPIVRMRQTGKPHITHAYVLLAYLGGLVELAHHQQNPEELEWIESVWRHLANDHLYPTGSLGLGERLHEGPRRNVPDGKLQETCATVEWLLLNQRLYRATGRTCYAAAIERVVYNALLAAQSQDGMRWTYFTPLDGRKQWFGGPTRCCYWSGPRGIALLPELVYATDSLGVRVELLESSRIAFEHAGVAVSLVQQADWTDAGRADFRVAPDEPVEFDLRIRLPDWAETPVATLNGEPLRHAISDGYLRIERTWQRTDRVGLRFEVATTIEPMPDNMAVVRRGPQIMSIDLDDQPDLDVDAIRLPADLRLIAVSDDQDRRRYTAEVLVGETPTEVSFSPYASAGQDGVYRTVFPLAP